MPTSTPDVYTRPGADAVEDAVWSARRDSATGYGIAVFDVEPGSITVTHYHAAGADPKVIGEASTGKPNPDYTPFETFRLVRRSQR